MSKLSDRWIRVTQLVLKIDRDHEWYALHRELVSDEVRNCHRLSIEWRVPDGGVGILDVLELEAKRHGLISDEPAPVVKTDDLAARLLATLGKAA